MLKRFMLTTALSLVIGCGGSAPGTEAPAAGTAAEEASRVAEPAVPAAEPATESSSAFGRAQAELDPETLPDIVRVVMETSKGTVQFETYPREAPKTVARILTLVNKNYYRGLRFHRVEPGFVVQVGDPKTRDMQKREQWGQPPAGTGTPIGVAEISDKLTHKRGAVAMAHAGDPAQADAQFYIMLGARPQLDGKYAIFGQVTSGMDVMATLEVGDVIKKMYVEEGSGTT